MVWLTITITITAVVEYMYSGTTGTGNDHLRKRSFADTILGRSKMAEGIV